MRTLLLIAICVAGGWFARDGYNWFQLHQSVAVTVTVAPPAKAAPKAQLAKPVASAPVVAEDKPEDYGDCRTCGGAYVTQGIGYYPPPL